MADANAHTIDDKDLPAKPAAKAPKAKAEPKAAPKARKGETVSKLPSGGRLISR